MSNFTIALLASAWLLPFGLLLLYIREVRHHRRENAARKAASDLFYREPVIRPAVPRVEPVNCTLCDRPNSQRILCHYAGCPDGR